jgi:membrane-associated phospholipid phosphatase
MRRRFVLWRLIGVTTVASATSIALTIVVTSRPSLAVDSRAVDIANELRTPWLDHAARVLSALGLIAIVGPALLLGAALLIQRQHRARAAILLVGAALAWISVWIAKAAVDRPRPPTPLVHTAGQSYPSAPAANSVGWLALAIALAVVIPTRGGRITTITAGALLTVLVGLSRIYLRAHYASDVLAGEAIAVTMYALATIAAVARRERRYSAGKPPTPRQPASRESRDADVGNARDRPTPPS